MSPTTFWSSLPPLTTTLLPEVASPSRSTKVNGESKEPPVSVTQQSRPRKVKEEDGKEQTTEKREPEKEEEEEVKRNERKGRKKRPQTGKKGKKRSQDPEVRL